MPVSYPELFAALPNYRKALEKHKAVIVKPYLKGEDYASQLVESLQHLNSCVFKQARENSLASVVEVAGGMEGYRAGLTKSQEEGPLTLSYCSGRLAGEAAVFGSTRGLVRRLRERAFVDSRLSIGETQQRVVAEVLRKLRFAVAGKGLDISGIASSGWHLLLRARMNPPQLGHLFPILSAFLRFEKLRSDLRLEIAPDHQSSLVFRWAEAGGDKGRGLLSFEARVEILQALVWDLKALLKSSRNSLARKLVPALERLEITNRAKDLLSDAPLENYNEEPVEPSELEQVGERLDTYIEGLQQGERPNYTTGISLFAGLFYPRAGERVRLNPYHKLSKQKAAEQLQSFLSSRNNKERAELQGELRRIKRHYAAFSNGTLKSMLKTVEREVREGRGVTSAVELTEMSGP
jgi:hypothetical protein